MADYADFPEYSAEAAAIEKRRKIAEMLMAQGMTPLEVNQMAGGNVVPIHPLQGLGQLAKAWVAKSQMDEADAQKKDLGTRYEGMKQAEIDKAITAMSPTPEIPAPPAELGGGPGRAPMQKSPEEMRQAIIETSLSRSPEVRAFGALQQKFMEADEARKAAFEQRKWEATQRAQDKLDQIAEAARQGRITKEEADKRHRDTLVELKKMGGAMNERPFYTFMPSTEGIVAGNGRTGQLSIPTLNGKPVVASASSPELQGQIAGAKKTGETQAKRAFNMAGLGETIDQAEKLLSGASGKPLPTGSTVGTAVDTVAGWVGASPEGAKEAQTLKAIGGALTSKMPRMEGPQSDKDTQLYKEMAAVVGDSTVPRDRRLAALQIVKELWGKYESLNQAPAGSGAGAGGWSIRKIQ